MPWDPCKRAITVIQLIIFLLYRTYVTLSRQKMSEKFHTLGMKVMEHGGDYSRTGKEEDQTDARP